MRDFKDTKEIHSVKSGRPSIYRSDSSYVNLSITNSRIINVDEKGRAIDSMESEGLFNGRTLERGLKSRHVQLIALGGCIGTGLFVGTGSALSQCGPAALFISYLIMSIVIFFVMNMLGEMTTFLPLPGNGAQAFVNDYVDDSMGFAIGYNYWYAFSMLVASEVTAASIVIQYWNTTINIAVWITIFLALVFVLNMSSVKYFGEAEFYFASLKLVAVTGLIILGIVLFFGGGPNHDRLGFRYWKHDHAFTEHLTGGDTGKFLAVWTAVIKSGFAFICSPELVSIAGGECQKPRRNIPKACNRFVYRLCFFYIFGTLVIGVIVNSKNKRLMSGGSDASASPFVIGIQNAGIHVLNHIINAVILTSAASAGNSFLYSASRALYSMALKGLAPSLFKRVNKLGVPYYCVTVSAAVGCLAYLNCSSSSSSVFAWFSNISTISGFISWIALSIAYLRWRKALRFHNLEERVTYRTVLQPYGAYFVIFFIGILTITNGYAVFFHFNIGDFLAAYITFPIVVFLYFGHKFYNMYYNKVYRWVKPIEEIDLVTGLDLVEEEDMSTPERVPKNIWEKIWFWIA
ncbi:Piso0_005886 [Millerozyma farinosa CBS 7064]|uniref:Piso0_005886 protein n=1 Tax=Pichia sorbitophila (strain ATCC MYA-4447 / BCRC 22081 / CBS 7064 / NBRC 10061 / NRRL Y-12695) TaxID=559304 RepID=G8Y078_PICSO|nr:Piso0_005886 [Millerozyma farinosa CBS 7064]